MILPEFKRLETLLSSFLGNPKNGVDEHNLQLQFPCPRCVEEKGQTETSKYNLEISLAKGLFSKGGVFQCWSCSAVDDEMKGGVYKLIARYGGREVLKEYKEVVNSIKDSGLYKLPEYSGMLEEDDFVLTLPLSYKKIKDINTVDSRVQSYLKKRHIGQDIIDKFNIGYTLYEEEKPSHRNRIIIPSYDEGGTLNFWLGRDFTGNDKRVKYCNCDNVKKTNIVYQESHIQWDADICIVEGGIDCIYAPNCTALLGKTLSREDELYRSLMERANANIIICLDADTDIRETLKIYRLLDSGRLKGKIRYLRLTDYKDFGEAYESGGKGQIIELLKTQQTFSEFECSTGLII